jgi:amino acid permease
VTDPHRRDRTRPLELLGISAAIAVFVGIFVFVGTRALDRALIFAGVSFVIALVVLAMLMLAVGPKDLGDDTSPDEPGEKKRKRPPH